jgi:glycosyltransferase involved in cell wall biosynthesis
MAPVTPTNPRKIALFAATSGHSGVETVIKNLVQGFSDLGYEVDLLTIRKHGPYLSDCPKNCRIIQFPTSHAYSSLPSLVRYLRKQRPVALLTDKEKVNLTAIWARALAGTQTRLAVRIGTTVSRDLQSRGWLERRTRRVSLRHFHNLADTVITPSEGAAKDLHQFGVHPQRTRAIPSPIISSTMHRLAEEKDAHPCLLQKQNPVVLGVGELSKRKNFSYLLQGFATLRRNMPCRLLILGDGKQRESLRDEARAMEIEEDVILPGYVANPYKHMRLADVFVLASRYEGSPVVLAEALGLGLPVVSTDCPSGPREILQNGTYGELVPLDAPEELADALYRCLQWPPDPQKQRRGAEPFSVEQSIPKYLEAMGLTDSLHTVPNDANG